jgi:nicotinate-nucleotide adenylyltransferase
MIARAQAPIGVFGGTFDPIHYGHLRTGYELLKTLELGEVRYLPCAEPPHRGRPLAPGKLRLEMVSAALAGQPGLVADDRELRRGGPSYSVVTLIDMRREFPDCPLCLIVGMDAFLGFPAWHRWRELFELAHVIVARRPGWAAEIPALLKAELENRETGDAGDLHRAKAGFIYIHTVTQLEISSTAIRKMSATGGEPRFLVPDSVCEIIKQSGCYTGLSTTKGKAFD